LGNPTKRWVGQDEDDDTPSPPIGDFYLLALGVDTYEHHGNLGCAVSDTDKVCEVLKGNYGFSVERIKEDATNDEIYDAVRSYTSKSGKGKITKNDYLVIWMAGHGVLDDIGSQFYYFVPQDGSPAPRHGNWVNMDELIGYFNKIPAHQILLIMDCCYSGGIFRRRSIDIDKDEHAHNLKSLHWRGRQGLASGRKEKVLDTTSLGYSPFAFALTNVLESNWDTTFTAHQLDEKMNDFFRGNPRFTQKHRLDYLKDAGGFEDGGFVFIRSEYQKNPFKNKKDAEVWNDIISNPTTLDLEKFVLDFPDSQYFSEANYQLGLLYCAKENFDLGLEAFRNAAKLEHGDAQFSIGRLFELGQGVTQDHLQASAWYEKAKLNGSEEATQKLKEELEAAIQEKEQSGLNEYQQNHSITQHPSQVISKTTKGMNRPNRNSKIKFRWLALLSIVVIGSFVLTVNFDDLRRFTTPISWESASQIDTVESYQKFAKRNPNHEKTGNAYVQISNKYNFGFGVERSHENAFKTLLEGAELGYPEAQLHLGKAYKFGYGTDKSDNEAVTWFRKSADQGNAEAQFQLGIAYEKGFGVKQSYEDAENWFQKAVANNHVPASASLDYVRSKITEQKNVDESKATKISKTTVAAAFSNKKPSTSRFSNGLKLGGYRLFAMNSIKLASDKESFLLTGTSLDPILSDQMWIAKLSLDGEFMWEQSFGGEFADYGEELVPLADAGAIAVGSYNQDGRKFYTTQIMVIRVDRHGNKKWGRAIEIEDASCRGVSIKRTTDNNYLVVSRCSFKTRGNKSLILKLTPNGKTIWKKFIGADYATHTIHDLQSVGQSFIAVGVSTKDNHLSAVMKTGRLWVIKFDKNGKTLWEKIIQVPIIAGVFQSLIRRVKMSFSYQVFLKRTLSSVSILARQKVEFGF